MYFSHVEYAPSHLGIEIDPIRGVKKDAFDGVVADVGDFAAYQNALQQTDTPLLRVVVGKCPTEDNSSRRLLYLLYHPEEGKINPKDGRTFNRLKSGPSLWSAQNQAVRSSALGEMRKHFNKYVSLMREPASP